MVKSTKVGEESHVYDAEGNLDGLWLIDGKAARQEFGNKKFWEGVDKIISLYREINPNEMEISDYENVKTKLSNNKETGSNKAGSFRQALNVPYGLYLVLIDYEPRMFRDKKIRTAFMKRYSFLRSCEVV